MISFFFIALIRIQKEQLDFSAQWNKKEKKIIQTKAKRVIKKKKIAIFLVGKVIEIERAKEKTRKDGERATNIIPHCYIEKD